MSLKTIPERLLYELLPSEIINLDERGILHAVVGGIQDHVEDIKSYAKKFEVFFDPTQAPPEGDYNVVVASFYGDQRQVVTRSVIIDETTPEADDQDALDTWTIAALGIEADTFISAEYGYDELRAVDVDILELLASTIGAVIYKTDAVTTVGQRRQAVESYFPRLKVKGTAQSYDVLGRLVGFNHVGYTPLWARVSPRRPDDIGHPDNDPDFSSQPHFTPQAQVSVTYDPNDLRDGAFFTWESGSLAVDASSEDYYTSVTGRNPFISVVPSGTLVGHPDAGVYPLAGGAPHKKASVSPSGAGLTFEALAEGEANNGLKVTVMEAGTLRKLRITDRLSSIKYRSSYFNLGLFRDLDTLGDEAFSAVQSNPDLEDYPTLATSGTAEAPYYPWTTGSIQAPPDALQLDTSGLAELQTQAVPYFEEVRSATRFPRRVSVGYSSTDQVGYAAYQIRTDLFVTSPADSYAGTVSDSPVYLYSARIGVEVELTDIASRTSPISTFLTATLAHAPERNKITLWNGATQVGEDDGLGRISDTLVTGTVIDGEVDYLTGELRVRVNGSLLQLEVRYSALIELSGETDNSNPNIINFNGTGLAGYYNLSTFEFNFTEVDGLFSVSVVADTATAVLPQPRVTVPDPVAVFTVEVFVSAPEAETATLGPAERAVLAYPAWVAWFEAWSTSRSEPWERAWLTASSRLRGPAPRLVTRRDPSTNPIVHLIFLPWADHRPGGSNLADRVAGEMKGM